MKTTIEIQNTLVSLGINETFFITIAPKKHYKFLAHNGKLLPTSKKQLNEMKVRLQQGHPYGSLDVKSQVFLTKLCNHFGEIIEFKKGNTVANGSKVIANGAPLYNALTKLIN